MSLFLFLFPSDSIKIFRFTHENILLFFPKVNKYNPFCCNWNREGVDEKCLLATKPFHQRKGGIE
jgi:hypothetical protein